GRLAVMMYGTMRKSRQVMTRCWGFCPIASSAMIGRTRRAVRPWYSRTPFSSTAAGDTSGASSSCSFRLRRFAHGAHQRDGGGDLRGEDISPVTALSYQASRSEE